MSSLKMISSGVSVIFLALQASKKDEQ